MPPRKPSFRSWSNITIILGLLVSILGNIVANYFQQPLCFVGMVFCLGIAIMGIDYLERYAGYDTDKREFIAQKRRRESTHFERIAPILRITLWRVDNLWRTLEQYALRNGETLQLACLDLSVDKRSWRLFLPHNLKNGKHEFPIPRGKTWIAKVETRSHDGKPKIIPLNDTIKNDIENEQHRLAFQDVQTALLIPVYKPVSNAAKNPYNMVALVIIYSTQSVDKSILGLDAVLNDAEKIGEKLDLVLSYNYLFGESNES